LNPFRHVTAAAMAFGRGSRIAKEARLHNEQVMEKTRIQDADAAAEEAWRLYEEAKAASGGGEVTKESLQQAYEESIPKDVLRRLEKSSGGSAARGVESMVRKSIEASVRKIQEKFDEIDQDVSLSPEARSAKKQKVASGLLGMNADFLKDIDRIVSQVGGVDMIAEGARRAEKGAKIAQTLLILDTVRHLPRIFSDIVHAFDRHHEASPVEVSAQAKVAPVIRGMAEPLQARTEVTEYQSPQGMSDSLAARAEAEASPSRMAESLAARVGDTEQETTTDAAKETTKPESLPDDDSDSRKPVPASPPKLPEQQEPAVEKAPSMDEKATDEHIIELSKVKKGDSYSRILTRELKSEPGRYGYDHEKDGDVDGWVQKTLRKVLRENGLVKKDGSSVGIRFDAKQVQHVVLGRDLKIHTYVEDENGDLVEGEIRNIRVPKGGFGAPESKPEKLQFYETEEGRQWMRDYYEGTKGDESYLKEPHLTESPEDAVTRRATGQIMLDYLKENKIDDRPGMPKTADEAFEKLRKFAPGINTEEKEGWFMTDDGKSIDGRKLRRMSMLMATHEGMPKPEAAKALHAAKLFERYDISGKERDLRDLLVMEAAASGKITNNLVLRKIVGFPDKVDIKIKGEAAFIYERVPGGTARVTIRDVELNGEKVKIQSGFDEEKNRWVTQIRPESVWTTPKPTIGEGRTLSESLQDAGRGFAGGEKTEPIPPPKPTFKSGDELK